MLLLSLHATLYFSSLQMFQKFTCINYGIQFTSMTLSIDSKWTKGRDLNSIWKSSKISLRSALEYRDKTLMHFLLMHQPWRTFAALINRSLSGKTTGATPPKKARKFKKPTSPQLTIVLETPEMPLSKKKKKVDIARGKGIELQSEVALTEDAQYKEVRRKSIKDFHKTHPSGSGTVTKTAQSVAKIKPSVTNEGTGVKPGVPDVTDEESSESEAESWGNDEDDRNNKHDSSAEDSDQENDSDDDKTQLDNKKEPDSEHETNENESGSESDQDENEEDIGDDKEEVNGKSVKTPSNDSDDEDETMITDKGEGDKYEEMDYTTSQLYDDVDIRLNEPVDTNKGFIQEEGTNAEITNVQQGNENPKISQVIEDAHVTLSIISQKTEVLVTSSSYSSDLASKFLKFLDILNTDVEIVSLMDVHVHHEVPNQQTPTLLTVHVSAITDSSLVYPTVIPQSLPSFTPPPQQSTSIPPPITEATNPQYTLPNFASVFQFNNRVTALEKEVAELKKDPLYTQVIALVDDHLDVRLGATRDEFMNHLSASITARITEQAVLAKESSQPQSSYETVATLTEFELKKILINKMDNSESYLAAPEHGEFYEGLIKSYDLDKTILSTYGKVYLLKRSRKDKDKDEDPSAGSDIALKKRKTSKDAKPTKGLKAKESQSSSSKGIKSQPKSSRKYVQLEEPKFKVADSDIPQDQEGNLGNDDDEPMKETVSKRGWFTKPTQPQEPTDLD
ncbi:hypothetical protein Tco_0973871 [Tanacetum coccineum]|uniref:Uncharacterized protein n=1 Tax=Tanacetum coccineum TaxID=301880 RepID=A0ABQ5E9Z1_9ASTR